MSHALSSARRLGRVAIAAGLVACSALAAAAGPGPAAAASAPQAHAPLGTAKPAARPAPPKRLVDINNASRKQLKTLPGVGDAEAERIVAGRPYASKAHLVSKKAIPAGVYLSIKRQIFAGPPKATPKA